MSKFTRTKSALICALLFVGLAPAFSGCNKKTDVSPIKVGAIFAVTGEASFLGAPQAKAAEMLVSKLNQAGGINGRQIQLIVKDSGSRPENAISLAKQLINEDKVLAIIGPSTNGETVSIRHLCQAGKTILLSCASAGDILHPEGTYIFKTAPNDSDAVRCIFKTMKEKGITRIGVIAGDGSAGRRLLHDLAPENGITIAATEAYGNPETDMTGLLKRIKAENVQAVIHWSAVPARNMVARNMRQIGLAVPLFQSPGFGSGNYVKIAGDGANGTFTPCGRILVAEALPADHPQKALLMAYKNDYEAQFNEEASAFGGYSYDGLLLLAEAIKQAGGTDRGDVRDALENLKGVTGTTGIFNFSAKDHGGLTGDAFEMLTVKDGKFAICAK